MVISVPGTRQVPALDDLLVRPLRSDRESVLDDGPGRPEEWRSRPAPMMTRGSS
jgi:hypothetical protein